MVSCEVRTRARGNHLTHHSDLMYAHSRKAGTQCGPGNSPSPCGRGLGGGAVPRFRGVTTAGTTSPHLKHLFARASCHCWGGRPHGIVDPAVPTAEKAMAQHVERFQGWSDRYAGFRPGYPDTMLKTLSHLIIDEPPPPGGAVADIGSGTGTFTHQLRTFLPITIPILGIVPASDMRHEAQTRSPVQVGIEYLDGTAENIPLRTRPFVLLSLLRPLTGSIDRHFMLRHVGH